MRCVGFVFFFFLAPQDVVGVSRDLNNKKKNRGSSGFSTVSPIVVLRPLGCFVLVIELELWDFGGIFVWFMRIHEESWAVSYTHLTLPTKLEV